MTKPNSLFILIDDLGWKDLGCYESTFYETPNLDRLAAEGVRFTNAYAASPVCSPTRASILTGRYPATLGLTNFIGGSARGKLVDAPYVDHLPLQEVTIARALSSVGYRTYHVGKWHLGGEARVRCECRWVSLGHAQELFQPVQYAEPQRRAGRRVSDGSAHR